MTIVYPVKYNVVDLSVEDAHGKVVALVSWPRDKRPLPEIHAIGRLMAESINSYETTQKMLNAGEIEASQAEPEREFKRGPGRPRKVA